MKKLSIICVISIILISGCVYTKNNSETIATSIETDEESCAEQLSVMERTLPRMMNISLLPGEIPNDLPVIVPIPENAVVIGSVVYSEGKYQLINIFIDIYGDKNEIADYYQNNLMKAGWNELEFAFENMPGSSYFCRYEGKGPSLMTTSKKFAEEKPIQVRLILDTNPRTWICDIPSKGINQAVEVMPILPPPTGAQVKEEGVGGDLEKQYIIETMLETKLSVSELKDHYQIQLAGAGWELNEDVGGSPSIALSTWSFTDEFGDKWSGILSVNKVGENNLHFVFFGVQLVY